jgi:hypothetical protein
MIAVEITGLLLLSFSSKEIVRLFFPLISLNKYIFKWYLV